MLRRIISVFLTLALSLTLFSAAVFAEGDQGSEPLVSYAVDHSTGEGYLEEQAIPLPINGGIYVSFELEPPEAGEGLIAGPRDDLLSKEGFGAEYVQNPFGEGPFTGYEFITPGSRQVGDKGTLYYNWYKIEDIFGENAPGWVDAVPVYSCSVDIEVVPAQLMTLLGDADGDCRIDLTDATAIQFILADMAVDSFSLLTADINRDGAVDIDDATFIQRIDADMDGYGYLGAGTYVDYGTYYCSFNAGQELLPKGCTLTGADAERAREDIRRALSLLIDRTEIIENILPVDRLAASTFVSKWISDADGSEFCANAGSSDEYFGYYDVSAIERNASEAVEILKKYYDFDETSGKFTNIPELKYIHNNSPVHRAIAESIKSDLETVGISVSIASEDWDTYLESLGERDFSLARNGWLAESDSPMDFLECWTSYSEDNFSGLGQAELAQNAVYSLDLTGYGIDLKVENGTWAQTYDALIEQIKNCNDRATAYSLMHLAEDMLMSTGCIIPLYYY